MIAQLTGTVVEVTTNAVIIDVGGVGYKVFVTATTLGNYQKGAHISLPIHTHVREEALDLYGFSNNIQKELFELLLTITGIGPKAAMGILSAADVGTIAAAIRNQDSRNLTQIPGIGKKTAERIILELAGKIDTITKIHQETSAATTTISTDAETIEALISLGYSTYEARQALAAIDPHITDVGEKIKTVLKNAGRRK